MGMATLSTILLLICHLISTIGTLEFQVDILNGCPKNVVKEFKK
jgi:hypothetical protein